MAVKLKFTCSANPNDFITVESVDSGDINIMGQCSDKPIDLILDVHTAIKLTKTLRTEINKSKEVQNG